MKLARITLALLLALASAPALAAEFALKDGDRVVFYGDSITDQRLYTTFVETFVVTRFPKSNITFVHSGWGGDRVGGGGGGPVDVRLQRDVVAYNPTVVSIMLGMNDASYRAFDKKIFDAYAKGYEHIVDTLKEKAPGVRLTLIQPSPFDDVTRKPNFDGGYNAVLIRYGDYLKELAAKKGASVADLNTTLVMATKKAEEADHETAVKFNQDRVHPGPAGQLLMAESLLKAWNAPATVSEVEIDAESGKVTNASNTTATELKANGKISWTQEDAALPFPINLNDPVTALAVKSSDILDALDRQMLTVKNAKASEYTLKIDGKDLGKFNRDQLAAGVNLATLDTPMIQQARHVHDLTLKHNNIHFTRWRGVEVPLQGEKSADMKAALEALDRVEASVVKDQREAAKPKPHMYELVPNS
ncbi:MAG: lysophospholipase L1-like esterase [Planctomycetota bacterium]|nr:lysophospholipase L1-like esterase [Planctomycetota bacterium]